MSRVARGADLSGWKEVAVEYGADAFSIRVPETCRILEMKEALPLPDPRASIIASLREPIGAKPLPEVVGSKGKPVDQVTVCIATSDITRPVPYKGESGILPPLLQMLQHAGVRRERITLLVGTGTHRPSTQDEKEAMFGPEVAAQYPIVDHDCDNAAMLVNIGRTKSDTEILINRVYYEADVKIATGLVESHFMAGVSGGRKAICPALVGARTIERFHGARVLSSPLATDLVLEGNPCHEEALEIAKRAGADFTINTVLNRRSQLVGVFSGDLELAHAKAVGVVRAIVTVPVEREYDVVLTHGGYVGINHYQNAKAAVGALPVVKPRGFLILAACERDEDPVGPTTYKTLLHLLKLQGPDGYLSTLLNPEWKFTRDQWEPQMWAKVLAKIGTDGLIYCSATLSRSAHQIVPGDTGWNYLPHDAFANDRERTQAMTQNALIYAVTHPRWGGGVPAVAFIKEGPYAVPVCAATAATS